MKVTVGIAHSLFIGLTSVDKDEKTKIDGKTRLAIAININMLRPHVEAYEKVRGGQARAIEASNAVRKDLDFADADAELRESEIDVGLKTFPIDGLKLDENTRITGAIIAMLAPVITGLE